MRAILAGDRNWSGERQLRAMPDSAEEGRLIRLLVAHEFQRLQPAIYARGGGGAVMPGETENVIPPVSGLSMNFVSPDTKIEN